jgi:hypothetical protein
MLPVALGRRARPLAATEEDVLDGGAVDAEAARGEARPRVPRPVAKGLARALPARAEVLALAPDDVNSAAVAGRVGERAFL